MSENLLREDVKNGTINYPAIIVLIGYPILILLFVVLYAFKWGISSAEVMIAVVAYYGSNIAIGVGMHRLWSHASYKTNKWIEFFLMMLSSGSLQGPVLAWVSDHKFHHAYADGELDPHTPVKYKDNKLKGFLWAHIGWMIFGESTRKHIDKGTVMKLGRKKMLSWQLRNYWQIAVFMNTVPACILGCVFLFSLSLKALLAGFIFVGLGRALQQQATFCVNSVCHMFGVRRYADDSSRDVWWMALFLLGENWHNFHHAFGNDYRNGHKWYHFDVHKWIIFLMSKIGLAWDVVVTSDDRILAKQRQLRKVQDDKLLDIAGIAQFIAEQAAVKIRSVEKCSYYYNAVKDGALSVKDSVVESVVENVAGFQISVQNSVRELSSRFILLHHRASQLSLNIRKTVDLHSTLISDRIVNRSFRALKEIQKMAESLGVVVQQI